MFRENKIDKSLNSRLLKFMSIWQLVYITSRLDHTRGKIKKKKFLLTRRSQFRKEMDIYKINSKKVMGKRPW